MKKRKEAAEEVRDSNAWMVTFSDLLTLLLTFFVLLLTMSSLDDKKLEEAFGFFTGALGALNPGGMGKIEKILILPPRALVLEAFSGKDFAAEKVNQEKNVKKILQNRGIEDVIKVDFSIRGIVLRISDRLLFDSGSANINSRAFPVLNKLSLILDEYSHDILIEGHTDNVPISTEKFPSNWELSLARATSIVRHLISKEMISPERLSAGGYGDSKPLFPNDNESSRAKNRRVEIILMQTI